jgi:dihydrodipicolinate synthase/N-acetylneuraminate lyase
MSPLPQPLRGVVPPVLTPLASRDSLDHDAFTRLIEHLILGGSNALFILGSTGEAPGLSQRLRREVIDAAASATAGRVPLLVGITDTSYVESLTLAEHAAASGASAIVLAPPNYYALTQKMFLGYLERLCAELPLPLYLYNMPGYTKIYIEPETLRAAAALPNVYGLKDSSGNRDYFRRAREAVAAVPDFSMLIGIEELMAEMVLEEGAHGGVCGGANLMPGVYSDLYHAAIAGNRARVAELQQIVVAISTGVYRIGEKESSYLRGLKCAAAMAGFGNGFMAEPYVTLTAEEQDQLRAVLGQLGILHNVT